MKSMLVRSTKRCPQCGKRPYDQRLETCPTCCVPYAYEYLSEPAPPTETGLSSDRLQALGRQLLRSWQFWAGLAVVVAAASWGVVLVANWSLDRRTTDYLGTLDDKVNQRLKLAYDRMSKDLSRQMSNQVASEFRSARIHGLVEQYAIDRVQSMLTNAVGPSLDAFRQKIELADAQLANSTNELVRLSNSLREAQRATAQLPSPAVNNPALLTLVSQRASRDGTNFILHLVFKSTNGKPAGHVDLIAGTFEQTAKILSFAAPGAAQSEEPIINDIGDAARLKFTVARGDQPVLVELVFSDPTIVRLTGDALEQELILPVSANRMQLPAGTK